MMATRWNQNLGLTGLPTKKRVWSGIQVKKEEEYNTISEMRLRHGSTWQSWRRTGSRREGSVQEAFDLEENEAVVEVRTNKEST